MNKIYLKRLTNLARIMREAQLVEKARDKLRCFNMAQWGYSAQKGETCGTPSCLLGHYAERRDVQRRFSLNKNGDVIEYGKNAHVSDLIQLAADHFGITCIAARLMFGNVDRPEANNAKTPAGAAQYVERFIARLPS